MNPRLPTILVLAAFLATTGCGPSGPAPRGVARADSNAEPTAADSALLESPDAVPRDLRLPEPVRRDVRAPLESWILAWRRSIPNLHVDQFARAASVTFVDDEPTPYAGSLEGAELRLRHLVVPSPTVHLLVDPFIEFELEPVENGGDLVRAVRVHEPGVVLVDLGSRTERRLLELPLGTRVDGAHWIDERRFVVFADEPAKGGRRPVLYLVHVAAGNALRYTGPTVAPEEAEAARTDLDRRFRAARPDLVQ